MIAATQKHNDLKQLEIFRHLEFAIYTNAYAGMSGVKVNKNIKKPSDLYPLPSDKKVYKKIIIDREQQKLSVDKVKQSTNFKIWQQAQ